MVIHPGYANIEGKAFLASYMTTMELCVPSNETYSNKTCYLQWRVIGFLRTGG
jgi:hypothetical protein